MQEQVSGINKRKITEAMTKDENIWGNVRFAILLVFTVVLIFIILCKYVFDVPIKESSELRKDINHSETIFTEQKAHAKKSSVIWNQIDSLDFSAYQVQRMDEIKGKIYGIQEIYTKNGMNSRFMFGALASKTLRFQFDIQEELSALKHNNELIEKDLEECKANL